MAFIASAFLLEEGCFIGNSGFSDMYLRSSGILRDGAGRSVSALAWLLYQLRKQCGNRLLEFDLTLPSTKVQGFSGYALSVLIRYLLMVLPEPL